MKLPLALLLCLLAPLAFAQAPAKPKKVPPPGVAIPENQREELTAAAAQLEREIADLKARSTSATLLPDIEIFHKAVDWALRYDEFYDLKQLDVARALLQEGRTRAAALRESKAPWQNSSGLVVRAYRSRIDDSVQPYGLVIPESWNLEDKTPRPLWIWLHGRNEKLTELGFVNERMKKAGDLVPKDAMVLHVYGRFCNANKFAGETDLFEALASVRSRYAVDDHRIVITGFSMGGAACWHLAAHHAGLWAAASPGAGFAETAVYQKVFAPGKTPPPAWEQKLWRLYDATSYAANLANCPTIAYSGETDPQIQSAELMEKAMAAEGLKLERFVGPKTGHKYEPATKEQLVEKLEQLTQTGRQELPPRVRFVTYTLRYSKMEWIEIDALEKHWERAEVDAELLDEGTIRLKTQNVAAFTISFPPRVVPLDKTQPPRIIIDNQELVGPAVRKDWSAHFAKGRDGWQLRAGRIRGPALAKSPQLQGPIDDAFYDSFTFVKPTGEALNASVGTWAKGELDRATDQWRAVFRGEPRVKDDTAITLEDIGNSNLVLWGDPGSNKTLAKILPDLPLKWSAEKLEFNGRTYDAAHHLPVLIFPNPLNPRRYVVLNSSFTFRAGAAQSNAQQTPKLPDWAVIDLRQPPDDKAPGKIMDAGFFDESWKLDATATR